MTTIQANIFDLLLMTGISITTCFLFEASVIPLCQTAVSYSHAIPFICWHFIWLHHEYLLLGGKESLFSTLESLSIIWVLSYVAHVPNDFICYFFLKRRFSGFSWVWFPKYSEYVQEENNLRDKLQKLPSVFNKGTKSKCHLFPRIVFLTEDVLLLFQNRLVLDP